MAKPRIAILGGGAGAVTAALELSKPGWENHYESISLYQQGWRLGGKGACGRGPDLRIEEHGLHLWFGFYENAFRLLDRCHRELDRRADNGDPRWDLAFKNVEESFSPLEQLAVADYDGCGWSLWAADFFEDDDDRPWLEPDLRAPDERPDQWTAAFYAARCLRLGADLAWSLVESDPGLGRIRPAAAEGRGSVAVLDDAVDLALGSVGGDVRAALDAAANLLDAIVEEAFDQPAVLGALGIVVRAVDLAGDFLRRRFDEEARASPFLRRSYYVVDLMVAIVRGLIEDGVIIEDSFDVVDDVDFYDWLLAHGAQRETADCALVRGIVYDLGFAYEGGDPQLPSCEAGTALRGLLRAFFTYRGSLMWRMNSGMGDVVFLPFYELLIKRGVEVSFFHRVEELTAANGVIEQIKIDVQANVPPNTPPEAYATVTPPGGGQAIFAWPGNPSAILDGAGHPAEDYESWYLGRSAALVDSKVLCRGADDGFDLVVFGLPISCVPYVALDLVESSPRWKAAADYLRTVPTQAMQLWLKQPASLLADVDDGIVVSGYVEPFDTWADMSQLPPQERVAGSATVAYFCNVLADAPPPAPGEDANTWLEDRKALVRAQAVRFLTHDVAVLWPGAVHPVTRKFDWNLLVAPPNVTGEDRLDEQYLRANVEPSERYVLSVPGSGEHRIAPDDTGFSNLYAVGDWTACVIDAGCVEAAVISGMLAANAIHKTHGDPGNAEPITGLEGP
jgi:uncharacterized protein with NAD-binding domain and iron-sulfur cluster